MNRHRFLVAILGGSLLLGLSGPTLAAPQPGSKILFITSNQHTYGDTTLNTANHFAEIVIAYDIFKKHGYAVDFVSPGGGAIPLGYIETSNKIQKDLLYNADFMSLLKNTRKPEQIRAADYQAVYYSGGGAAMFGVADHPMLQHIAVTVYEHGGIISAVCHGTAGLVHLKDSNGKAIFANRKVTGFPDLFEDTKAAYYKTFPFSIGNEISKHGGNFVYSKKWGDSFHVVDGNIITGQDPSSTAVVAEQVIKAIEARNPR
jgi:putative intracellular protease/amidase